MIPLSPQGSPPQSQLSNSSTFPPVSLGLLGDVNAFGDDPLPLQPELFPSVPQDGEEGRVYLPGGRIENNSVVEGEGNNNGDGCIASVDIKKKHASKNTRRVDMMRHLRVNLTDKFTALRLLIPQNGRASIIEDAIGYINELKRTVTELKALVEKKRISLKRPKMKDSPTKEPNASKNIDPYSRSSLRSSWIHRKSKNSEVDVRIIHDEVTVKLIQHKRINRLLFVSKALNELQLDLHHVSGRVIGDYYSYHFNSKERFYFSDSILPVFETGIPLLKQRLQKLPESDKIVVAFPDDGAWKRFHKLLDHFPMVICNKVREGDNRIVRIKEGNPAGCHVVIVDDLVQSGGTLIECQKVLAAQGAAKVSADVTHDVFPKNFWERVVHKNDGKIAFSHFWITDSCPHTVKTLTGKAPFEVLSLAGSISNALQI